MFDDLRIIYANLFVKKVGLREFLLFFTILIYYWIAEGPRGQKLTGPLYHSVECPTSACL